jgi:hypothetical protein
MSDPRYPSGDLYYWKSRYLNSLADEVLDEIVTWTFRRPSPSTFVNLLHMGGAIDRVSPTETAFSNRSIPYLLEISSNWSDPAQSAENIAWTRAFWAAMERFSPGATYLNMPGFGEEGEALVKSAFGDNYRRLVELKTQYDPGNLFRLNQNIKPLMHQHHGL